MKKSNKTKIAIFDIDGTIFRSSLLIEYIDGMVEAGIFPKKVHKEVSEDYYLWLDRKESYDKYIMSVVRVHQKYIKNVKVELVKKVIEKVIAEQKDRNYKYTKKLISDLKKKGYLLMAISGSPQKVVESFSKYLGFNFWFGQIYEVNDGKFSGNVVLDNSISRKDVVVDMWAKSNNVLIDYKSSYAIGDSAGDISILKKVGHPIAFNPNSELAKLAKKKNWKIVIERKDMIYEINKFKILCV